jgi:hypothetical protein
MTRNQEQELLKALRVNVDQIDGLIEMGHYTSRADFLREAVERLLVEHHCTHADTRNIFTSKAAFTVGIK